MIVGKSLFRNQWLALSTNRCSCPILDHLLGAQDLTKKFTVLGGSGGCSSMLCDSVSVGFGLKVLSLVVLHSPPSHPEQQTEQNLFSPRFTRTPGPNNLWPNPCVKTQNLNLQIPNQKKDTRHVSATLFSDRLYVQTMLRPHAVVSCSPLCIRSVVCMLILCKPADPTAKRKALFGDNM